MYDGVTDSSSAMLQRSDFRPVFVMPSKDTDAVLNVITISQNLNDNTNLQDLSYVASKTNSSDTASNKDIYVCTFCQVFSPSLTDVTEHIASSHVLSIPAGRSPEEFVSKLQALNKNAVKERKKVGRPRKSHENGPKPQKPKQLLEDPVPGADGLFWCKKCLRNFKKPRQLTQHICLDPEELDSCSDDSCIESEDNEFKPHVDIDPVPWSRRKVRGISKENFSNGAGEGLLNPVESSNIIEINENKVVPNWRADPSYVPLFYDEKEKTAFEEHLKSIDYSFVDGFFQKEEKRCRSNNKNNCNYIQSIVYRCNICKKVLKSLSHIRIHCLTHTDLKPFTCPKCDYSSNSKGSLYMHMRKHTGNMFCCSFCDFKCVKRAHLLDHEATHSSIPQICKLCRNAYKTLRSLIAHIKRYHNYAGGKMYIKSLTSKQDKKLWCNICKKRFKSSEILNTHNRVCHADNVTCDRTENILKDMPIGPNLEEIGNSIQMHDPSSLEQPREEIQCNIQSKDPLLDIVLSKVQCNTQSKDPLADIVLNEMQCNTQSKDPLADIMLTEMQCSAQSKDPLADIVLNDLLQQEQSQSIMYDNEFSRLCENMLPSSFLPKVVLEDYFLGKEISSLPSDSSFVEECQKTLDLNLLNHCLQNTDFSSHQDFCLQPNMANEHSLQNISENTSDNGSHLQDISENKCEEPVEVKLFEKCRRAPAYVCCECSAIYICQSALKVHLKEHVNSTSGTLIEQPEEQFGTSRIAEATRDLNNVCEMLQESSESCSFDKELEKLYTSSLDMMWYLPRVSVVLQTEPALFDPILDDIGNFPMSDTSQDLGVKCDDENVLKCFDEI